MLANYILYYLLVSVEVGLIKGIVGNLGSNPGSLNRATGEKVTESEVSRVFRGTDNIGNQFYVVGDLLQLERVIQKGT